MAALEKRIGVIGIVVEDLKSAAEVNVILHEYSHIIVGRMGIPYREKGISVIALIVDGTSDEISAMTGKLGKIDEVVLNPLCSKMAIKLRGDARLMEYKADFI